ncbi:MAG: POTRA domain-containing protein, partial [Woeseiaceae bacterium]|nr:POTRA domain-containing protein [Woeseiaceae bacterium]
MILLWANTTRAELWIDGINGEPARNIRLFTPLASEPCDAEEWLIRRRYRNLARDAARALEPFGYYEATFETSLRFEEECWIAELTVTPGTPVRLRRVDIVIDGDAQDDPAFLPFLRHTRLASGEILRHA